MSTNSTRREMLLTEEKKPEPLTMYIQNRRNSSKFNGCSSLQLHLGLISLKPAIAYFAYTKRCSTFMKSVIQFILVLILSSCASKKSIERKSISEYELESITKTFDAKKLSYIGLKKYCVGGIRIEMQNEKDCKNCYSENDIYIFWTDNNKSYVQKFDNCSEFNTIEIFDFKLIDF